MLEAALSYVFKRFYGASNIHPQQISGFGIGLYMVQEIVTRHGGQVEVESTEGVGRTFTIWLPVISARNALDIVAVSTAQGLAR